MYMSDFPDKIDGDAYRITWLIRRLFRVMGQVAAGYLEDLDVTSTDRAVMELVYPDKRLSVPDIARRYRVSRQHVQVTVNALMEKGLVTAMDNPHHKRSPLIALEQEGRALFETILARDQDALDAVFADIPRADRRQARETLEKLLNNLS
jgi:DNA-binding MarR family transcriptional regulator